MTDNNIKDLLNIIDEKLESLNQQLNFLSNEKSFRGYTHYESDKRQTQVEIEQLKHLRQILINFQKFFKEELVKKELKF